MRILRDSLYITIVDVDSKNVIILIFLIVRGGPIGPCMQLNTATAQSKGRHKKKEGVLCCVVDTQGRGRDLQREVSTKLPPRILTLGQAHHRCS